MTNRAASFVAASASLIVLWLGLAGVMLFLFPTGEIDVTLAWVEGIATFFALVVWYVKSDRWGSMRSPGAWIGIFAIAIPISVLFVEIDCGGTLHVVGRTPTCANYGGGISVVFTIAALALTAIALPSALRMWLLNRLGARPGVRRPQE